jgi:hypothetical protein
MQEWQIEWSYGAVAALKMIPWRQAARVDAAVQCFARTGEGNIEWIGAGRDARLYVPPYVVKLDLNFDARLIRVWSLAKGSRR